MQEKDINLIHTNEFGTILGTEINQLIFSKRKGTTKLLPFRNSLAHEQIRLQLMTNRLFFLGSMFAKKFANILAQKQLQLFFECISYGTETLTKKPFP